MHICSIQKWQKKKKKTTELLVRRYLRVYLWKKDRFHKRLQFKWFVMANFLLQVIHTYVTYTNILDSFSPCAPKHIEHCIELVFSFFFLRSLLNICVIVKRSKRKARNNQAIDIMFHTHISRCAIKFYCHFIWWKCVQKNVRRKNNYYYKLYSNSWTQ